ncbi:phage tail protein [Aggregatibacter actinomycetemcomitans]|uniref:phage tail protein n=1 Tax=Aggregatibacter actinomycetemcomitans TaxID=714 RepID=UPI00197B3C2A|nr:phage tail protein [Aggregatibacter actinomycetemcomitans]MBN6079893.1 phage tail protein [Aggregatibacter actinomycetemcomitans]
MKKPNQIRKALEESNSLFVQHPDRLQLYTDGGQIICTGAKSLSYEYRYTLNIIVTDYADDIAKIIVPVLAYLRVNQPELFENPARRENGFKFITDYNNNDTLDLSLEIQLTERVVQQTKGNGDVLLQYAPEPTWQDWADEQHYHVTIDGDQIILKANGNG